MVKKKQHGGKRPGAGRPPSSSDGPTMLVSVTVPQSLVAQLDDVATKREWNRSKAVTEAIRRLVKSSR